MNESNSLRQRKHLLDQKALKAVTTQYEVSKIESTKGSVRPGMTVEEFGRMQNNGQKEDAQSKVALFLGTGLGEVTEEDPIPERRAVTSYKNQRPKLLSENLKVDDQKRGS